MSETQSPNENKPSSNDSKLGCVAIILVGALSLFLLDMDADSGNGKDTSSPVKSNTDNDAYKVATAFQQAAGGSAYCTTRRRTLTIRCSVNAHEIEAERIASAVVYMVNDMGINLRGWSLEVTTLTGHTITRHF